jgi:two-component system cell cycle response regulator
MRALIIENSRVYCLLLDNILGQQGFDSDICDSIASARLQADSRSYDVVCISHHLKDGYGYEFVEYCRNHGINQDTSILYLTSDQNFSKKLGALSVNKIIFKLNKQQISHQIAHFIQAHLDPIFSEGRILLIEDSKTVAAVILSVLKNTGYQVERFSNAEDAWSFFENEVSYGSDRNAFDLVITDINLEGLMTGQELSEKIRSLEDARGFIPIFAITGDTSDELRLSLYESGVNDFIRKPVMARELLVRIGNLITNKRLLDKVHDQRRELFALATTDKLTGCHNRHSLMQFSLKFIALSERQQYPISMLVIDLDHFKSINDNYGHAVGDVVLEAVGMLLNKFFREGDLVARFGGEEFVVLMSHCDKELAHSKAEKLCLSITELRPEDISFSASIGVTTRRPEQKCNFESLFSAADKALYQAKENGRNCVVFETLEV